MQTQKKKIIKELLSNTFSVFLAGMLFMLALIGICSFFFSERIINFFASLAESPYAIYIVFTACFLSLFIFIFFMVKKYKETIKPSLEQMKILDGIARGDYSSFSVEGEKKSALVELMDERIKNLFKNLQVFIKQVEKSTKLQKSILEQLNEGIIATNDMGEIKIETQLVKEMLQSKRPSGKSNSTDSFVENGYSNSSSVNSGSAKNLERFIFVRNVNYAKVWEIMTKAMESESTVVEDFEVKVDGINKVIQVFASPMDDDTKGALAAIRDVTVVKSLERQRQDFVANVSHELKTPLTSILGYIELAKSPDRNIEELRQFQEIISIEAQHLRELIGDLLDLAEIENGQKNVKPVKEEKKEYIYFYQVVDEIFGQLSTYARKENVKLLLEVDPEAKIKANYTRIKQLFFNLITNAIKYNKSGGYVRVGTNKSKALKGERLEVFVEDNGIGISKAEQQRVFERFYRVDKSRSKNVEGTGLGLAIVKHIANLYNASVILESELGKGSKFTILFPKN